MGHSLRSAQFLVESKIADATRGDINAYYDLGIAYSSGTSGIDVDLVQAHKWFNLAALGHHDEAQMCRAEVADEMSAREIAEAQRQARSWLQLTMRQAA